jgi:hypothetical protein
MADPFRGDVEGRTGCASYRLFLSRNYPMVVRDGHRRALRSNLQSRDLSCEGRSEIGRRSIRDSKWDYHGGIDWPLHSHLGGQKDLTNRCSQPAGYSMHTYEIRPRKDGRGFDLISDALPFGPVVFRSASSYRLCQASKSLTPPRIIPTAEASLKVMRCGKFIR